MLVVKTYLDKSEVNGIGCFADEFIPKGATIWQLSRGFDVVLILNEFLMLPAIAQEHILHFAYYNKEDGGYVLCSDNAKFFNHSDNPNTEDSTGVTTALRDIQKGEEILSDYYTFDALAEHKLSKTN